MTLIHTETLTPETRLPGLTNKQVYCGLDSCLTLEVLEEIEATYAVASPEMAGVRRVYDFERALQAPYLEIMQRGFRVDEISRRSAAADLRARIESLSTWLTTMAAAVWDRGLNPRSPAQIKEFFYGAMCMPEVWINQKEERKLSTNREALEKLDQYIFARPFVSSILAIRDLAKQLEVFETDIDADGRFRASYNISGTETGRPSSSENAFGTGGNAQNIRPSLRYVFVADPGKKLCVIDLEQVEARDVGFFCGCLFNEWRFLDACESGDLHSTNAKLIWPELPWTGDKKKDRAIADRIFYRDFSYRDMAKRGSHLSNYSGTAFTAARALKVPIEIMEEFQARYCRGRAEDPKKPWIKPISPAYPEIARYWQWIAAELQTKGLLVTPFGRRRHFLGRPEDATTIREAIAFLPQSTTADRMNLGMWRVWKAMPEVELLAQTYDSITFQYDEDADESEIIGRALELLRVELVAPNGRKYTVPGEAKVGFNWGAEVTDADVAKAAAAGRPLPRLNPLGLRKFKPGAKDERRRPSILQRRISA